MERIAERNYWAEGETKHILQFLQEEDENFRKAITSTYEDMERSGLFDAKLPTTSAKQATAHLLTMCGLDFDKMVDVSSLPV